MLFYATRVAFKVFEKVNKYVLGGAFELKFSWKHFWLSRVKERCFYVFIRCVVFNVAMLEKAEPTARLVVVHSY